MMIRVAFSGVVLFEPDIFAGACALTQHRTFLLRRIFPHAFSTDRERHQ